MLVLDASLLITLAGECLANSRHMAAIVERHLHVKGAWPRAAETELEAVAERQRAAISRLAGTRATSLEECRAKARVLRLYPETPTLLSSLLDDMESVRCANS